MLLWQHLHPLGNMYFANVGVFLSVSPSFFQVPVAWPPMTCTFLEVPLGASSIAPSPGSQRHGASVGFVAQLIMGSQHGDTLLFHTVWLNAYLLL